MPAFVFLALVALLGAYTGALIAPFSMGVTWCCWVYAVVQVFWAVSYLDLSKR